MKTLSIFAISAAIVLSCAGCNRGDVLHEVLSHKELVTARELVDVYDSFISVHLDNQDVPVEQSYATFLQFNAPFAKAALDTDNFKPSPTRIIDVIYELGTADVKKFLLFDRKCRNLRIARDGKYLPILEKLAPRREIYAKLLEKAKASSGPEIAGDWLVIDEFGSIDFSREDERLVFMLNVFSIPRTQLPL